MTEADLQTLLDAVPAYVAWLDRNCQYVRVNRAYETGFGRNRASLVGLSVAQVFGPDYAKFIAPYVERVLAGETLEFETRADIPQGNARELRVRYTPRRGADGEVDGFIAVVMDVTAENRTRQDLQETAQRFKIALRNSRASVFEQDLNLRYTWAHNDNPLFPPELLIGKTDRELNPGAWCDELEAVKRRVIETGGSVQHEVVIPVFGESLNYVFTIEPARDAAGRVRGILASAVNVTDVKRIQNQLRESENRYRIERERFALIFDQSPVGLAVFRGHDLVLEMCNPASDVILPGRTYTGKKVTEAIPEIDPGLVEILRGVLTTSEPFQAREVLQMLDADGDGVLEPHWFDFEFNPIREADGSVSSLVTVTTEVTDRVLAAREYQQQWRLFDTVLSNTPDYMYVLDAEGRFLYANQAFTGLFQLPAAGIVGKRLDELPLYPAALAAKLVGQIRQALETNTRVLDETEFAGADGQTHLFEYIFSPVANQDGSVTMVAGGSRDITERKRSVDQLRQSMEQLQQMNRELEEFAYVASHDLQEPLRTVNVYTQLLVRRHLHGDGEAQQYATFIRGAVGRMEELIRDLLSYSRVVHPDGPEMGTADLETAFSQAQEALRTAIEDSGAIITSDPLPAIRGDGNQFMHVFQNLLSNALKYRTPGVPPVIHVSCRQSASGVTVSVQDNGIGFDQQYARRIFGLFKRLHKNEYPGTGLGLAICQRVIERSGGKIWAESSLGEGATFHFTLPLHEGGRAG